MFFMGVAASEKERDGPHGTLQLGLNELDIAPRERQHPIQRGHMHVVHTEHVEALGVGFPEQAQPLRVFLRIEETEPVERRLQCHRVGAIGNAPKNRLLDE
jgi:hypothetical protein